MMSATPAPAGPRPVTIRALWIALTAAILVYGAIAWMMRQMGSQPAPSLPAGIIGASLWIAMVLVVGCLGAAWALGGMAGPRSGEPAPGQWQRIQTGVVVTGAIAEQPALIGLIMFFLGMPFGQLAVFLAGSLLIQVLSFFRMEEWIGAARSLDAQE